jgi:tRNA A-37 threonylcarbamoyl transferase component Bud32
MQIAAQTLTPDLSARSVAGDEPFSLMLADGHVLRCERIVRRVPGKRIVCQGYWQGKPVFAKIFLGESAERHMQRDQQGSLMLATNGIATPALLYADELPQAAGQVLLYAAIAPCSNAEAYLHSLAENEAARLELMTAVSRLVAQHHQAGLLQTDMYLKNFLVQNGQLYTLDGDGIRRLQDWCSRRKALSNLARLISKQDVGDDGWIPQLYRAYCTQRGWMESASQLAKLIREVACIRSAVAREYADRKVLRECSDVQVRQDATRFLAVARGWATRLGDVLENPDRLLAEPENFRLKSGNTCTVSLTEVSGQKVVVKRYNIKNFWHGLNRAWRPSRAASAWSNAFRLNIHGIATAAPVALLERRLGMLRREAYFLAEYVDAPDIAEWMAAAPAAQRPPVAMATTRLLHKMQRLQLAHGDLKATNIKIVEGKPVLIDLDSLREYRCSWIFGKRHARDLRRLLKNWQHDAAVQEIMAQALLTVYGNDPVLESAGINRKTNETI